MTPLRKRRIEDMQRRGFSPRTQEAYVHAVHRLAQHFHTSPDLITHEDLRQCFLHLTQVQHYARATENGTSWGRSGGRRSARATTKSGVARRNPAKRFVQCGVSSCPH